MPAHAAGRLDRWAAKHHLHGAWRMKDTDHDGLINRREYGLRTDPRKADSDADGLRDGDELAAGMNPRKRDSDGDGTLDGDENAGVIGAVDGSDFTIKR